VRNEGLVRWEDVRDRLAYYRGHRAGRAVRFYIDKADQEMREMQKDLHREVQELEKEIEKLMPKSPQP